MDVFAYPMRFAGGRIAVVDEASTDGITQQLRILVGTRRGERHLAPAYGIADPTFRAGVDPVDVQAGVELFGPADVQVGVESVRTATRESATLVWSRDLTAVATDPGTGR